MRVPTDIDKVPIIRHIKVAGTKSPDDPELKEYWLKRKTKTGRQRWAEKSKYFNVAQAQGWKCPICHDHLFNGEQTLHPPYSTYEERGFRRRGQPKAPS